MLAYFANHSQEYIMIAAAIYIWLPSLSDYLGKAFQVVKVKLWKPSVMRDNYHVIQQSTDHFIMMRSNVFSIVDIFTNWIYFMNYKYTFTCYVISQLRVGVGNLNNSLRKIRTYLFSVVNMMAADNQVIQEARPSVAMVLTLLSLHITLYIPKELT